MTFICNERLRQGNQCWQVHASRGNYSQLVVQKRCYNREDWTQSTQQHMEARCSIIHCASAQVFFNILGTGCDLLSCWLNPFQLEGGLHSQSVRYGAACILFLSQENLAYLKCHAYLLVWHSKSAQFIFQRVSKRFHKHKGSSTPRMITILITINISNFFGVHTKTIMTTTVVNTVGITFRANWWTIKTEN